MLQVPRPLLRPHWDMRPAVDRDLSELADQMHRCVHRDNRRLRLLHSATRLLHWLQRHLVSIVVLVALLGAAVSLAAP